MLLAHLLTFDPDWLRRWTAQRRALLLFDGECAFCHATVRLALAEDRHGWLSFAPLSSPVAQAALDGVARTWHGDTIVLVDERGYAVKSRAVAGVLEHMGGLWFLLAQVLRAIPRTIADKGYDAIGSVRYRLGGRKQLCPLLPPERLASSSITALAVNPRTRQ